MNLFLTYVRDPAYFHLLPEGPRAASDGRIRVMAFPPLGIQTLAPVLRKAGHRVRMFDTCHPQMQAEDIAKAARQDRPDVIALSFLSVTAYPAMKALARHVKEANPEIPIIVGDAFASINSERILSDCPYVDHVGVGEGEELLLDYLAHLDAPEAVAGLTWRNRGGVVKNAPRPMISDLDRFPYADRTSLPIDYIECAAPRRTTRCSGASRDLTWIARTPGTNMAGSVRVGRAPDVSRWSQSTQPSSSRGSGRSARAIARRRGASCTSSRRGVDGSARVG